MDILLWLRYSVSELTAALKGELVQFSWCTFLWFDQVAERQGKYLAGLLNRLGKEGGGRANSAKDMNLGDPFMYKHLGSMATVGRYKALVDLRESKVFIILWKCFVPDKTC